MCARRRKYALGVDKSKCARCGFVPQHACQMDIDHVDGNSRNHAAENLEVLCANCHRLKTYERREGQTRYRR